MFYSKSTGGFYDEAIHTSIPADAVEITAEEHAALLEDQSRGKVITADANGLPVAVAPASLMTLAEAQSEQIAKLSAACQAQIYAGFQSSALGAVHNYPAKDKDQANLSASVVASLLPNLPAGWTTPFWCEDSTGAWSLAPHTAAQIQQVGSDGKAAIVAALEKNDSLANQVMAATDVPSVQAIVW